MPTASRNLLLPLGLFVLGFLSAALQLGEDAAIGPAFETVSVARNLAAGLGFSNPFQPLPTGPTALIPPVYPALMAGVIRLFGYGGGFVTVMVVLQLVLNGIQAALLPAVSERLLGQRRPGFLAAGALICLPVMPVMPQFEMELQIVILLLFVLIPVTKWSAVPAALFAALALHVNPSSLFLLGGWMLWKRPGIRWSAIWVGVLVIACAPWAIRNYTVTGRLVFIRNNFPLELHIANNEIAGPEFFSNLQSFRSLHPNNNAAEARAVQTLGETAYFDRCGLYAREWIRRNPGRFLHLTAQRAFRYWVPRTEPHHWFGWIVGLLTLLAIPALLRLYKNPVFTAGLLLSPLLYFVVQADYRYRMPYFWLTLLAASCTVANWLDRRAARSAGPPSAQQ